jgi:cytidine deaminase
MGLSDQDQELLQLAKGLVKNERIPGGNIGTVAAALRTKEGDVFSGVCLHIVCGIGFCAEHTAIATAVSQKSNVQIDTIVAVSSSGIVLPCGRCRELMNVLSEKSSETQIIISKTGKQPLSVLLPYAWSPTNNNESAQVI